MLFSEFLFVFVFFFFTSVPTLLLVMNYSKKEDRILDKLDHFTNLQNRILDVQESINKNTYHISRVLDMFARDTSLFKNAKKT